MKNSLHFLKGLLWCIFSGILFPAFAQKHLADSLSGLLVGLSENDTAYLKIQWNVARAQLAISPVLADSTARVTLALARKNKFPRAEIVSLNTLGVAAQRRGYYAEAVEHYLIALELSQTTQDTTNWTKTLNNLGLAYFYSKDYRRSLQSFRQGLTIQKDAFEAAKIQNNMGIVFRNQKQLDSALIYFYRALPSYIAQKSAAGLASAYSNIGLTYLDQKDPVNAERFFRQALDEDQKSGNRNGEAISICNIGVALAKQKKYREAAGLLQQSLVLLREQGNLNTQHYATENLYQLYEQQGRTDSAYFWFKQFHGLQDSLTKVEERDKIAEITGRYARDKQLAQAAKELSAERQRRWLWVSGIAALLTLLALTIYAYWQTRRRQKVESQLRAEEIKQLKDDKTTQAQREQTLQQSLEQREQVVASQSMHLLQKQELLEQVSGQLQQAVSGGQPSDQLKTLLKQLQNDSKSGEQWEIFQKQFETVHQGYFQRLLARQPRLTAHDLRYCAYLRMNLTTKEIANLMNTSLRSVETQRYRLRKKLDIESEQDLTAWLLQV